MECPYIDRKITPSPGINEPMNYKDFGGEDYVFYEHTDLAGDVTKVQFCQLCGRKTVIFECLNESEWKRCRFFSTRKFGARKEG